MKNFNLVVVENGNEICLASDATDVKVKNDELTFICDDGACEDVYPLYTTESVIIRINR